LNRADIVVGHNIKFDMSWIRQCGFVYDGALYDTMVAEYILARSQAWPLSLAAVAGKYGGTQKEKDLVAEYIKDGYTFYDIPWEIVKEYGIADVKATEEVALEQLKVYDTTFEEIIGEPSANSKAVA